LVSTEFYLIHSFIHSFILETYTAPFQEIATQRRFKSSHNQNWKLLETEISGVGQQQGTQLEGEIIPRWWTYNWKALNSTIAARSLGFQEFPLSVERSIWRSSESDTGQQR